MGRGRRTSMPAAGRASATWRRSPRGAGRRAIRAVPRAATAGGRACTTSRAASTRSPASPAPTATGGTRASATRLLRRRRPAALLRLPPRGARQVRAARAPQGDEGVVSCLDCHQPHGTRNARACCAAANDRALLQRCHGDLEGPFVFEHVGLVTEGCAALPRPARQRESPPAHPPAGGPALLRVPHRHADDHTAAELPRLHALSRRHPRIEHRRAVPRAIACGGLALPCIGFDDRAGADAGPRRRAAVHGRHGDVARGYRIVDIDGSDAKYREDYNLRSGVRLFDLDVDGAAKDARDDAPRPLPPRGRDARRRAGVALPADGRRSRRSTISAPTSSARSTSTRCRSSSRSRSPATCASTTCTTSTPARQRARSTSRVRAPHLPTLIFGYRLYEGHGDGDSTVLHPRRRHLPGARARRFDTNVGRVGTEFEALGTRRVPAAGVPTVTRARPGRARAVPEGVDPTDASTLTQWLADQHEHIDARRRRCGSAARRRAGRADGRLLLQPRRPDVRRRPSTATARATCRRSSGVATSTDRAAPRSTPTSPTSGVTGRISPTLRGARDATASTSAARTARSTRPARTATCAPGPAITCASTA